MRRLADASEEEVVLSFLVAEKDSCRWGYLVADAIDRRWDLLEDPHLDDPVENAERARILCIGVIPIKHCFKGFPGRSNGRGQKWRARRWESSTLELRSGTSSRRRARSARLRRTRRGFVFSTIRE